LVRDGNHVVCIDNLVTGRAANIAHLLGNPRFAFIEHDVVKALPALPQVTRIYHLASPASPPAYQSKPIETMRVNSEGTRRLLDLALRDRARFLYASTSEVYGDPLEHPQREEYRGNVSPVGPRSMYDEAKRYGEALSVAYAATNKVDVRIARIFNTYGPRMDQVDGRVVSNFIVQALRGEPLSVYGDGSQTRSFQYVDDLVDGLTLLMESACPDPINIGNPAEHTVLQLARLVRALADSASPIEYRRLPGDDPRQRRPDISRAKSSLGWEPRVPVTIGLARTITYFRKELGLSHLPAGRHQPDRSAPLLWIEPHDVAEPAAQVVD
jgi:nucleoside-diphosphate-sugar epimerase